MLDVVREGPLLFWDRHSGRWMIVFERVWSDGLRTFSVPGENRNDRELAVGFLELRTPNPKPRG